AASGAGGHPGNTHRYDRPVAAVAGRCGCWRASAELAEPGPPGGRAHGAGGEPPDRTGDGPLEQLRRWAAMTTSTLTSAREAVDRAVGLMPTLDLAEVTAAADLQTRTDRKYLVPAADF